MSLESVSRPMPELCPDPSPAEPALEDAPRDKPYEDRTPGKAHNLPLNAHYSAITEYALTEPTIRPW